MIKVTKSVNADSRTMSQKTKKPSLLIDTRKHIRDVGKGLEFIADLLRKRGKDHDHTKIQNPEDFYQAIISGHIKDTEWYKYHTTEERHHLKVHVPDDVNLIDVLEHLVDCTMAGLTRSGEIYDTDIPAEVLVKAAENTVKLIKENTKVVNPTSSDD